MIKTILQNNTDALLGKTLKMARYASAEYRASPYSDIYQNVMNMKQKLDKYGIFYSAEWYFAVCYNRIQLKDNPSSAKIAKFNQRLNCVLHRVKQQVPDAEIIFPVSSQKEITEEIYLKYTSPYENSFIQEMAWLGLSNKKVTLGILPLWDERNQIDEKDIDKDIILTLNCKGESFDIKYLSVDGIEVFSDPNHLNGDYICYLNRYAHDYEAIWSLEDEHRLDAYYEEMMDYDDYNDYNDYNYESNESNEISDLNVSNESNEISDLNVSNESNENNDLNVSNESNEINDLNVSNESNEISDLNVSNESNENSDDWLNDTSWIDEWIKEETPVILSETHDRLAVNIQELIDFTSEDFMTFANAMKKVILILLEKIYTSEARYSLYTYRGFEQDIFPLIMDFMSSGVERDTIEKLLKKYNVSNTDVSMENIQLKNTMIYTYNMIVGLYFDSDHDDQIRLFTKHGKTNIMNNYLSYEEEFPKMRRKSLLNLGYERMYFVFDSNQKPIDLTMSMEEYKKKSAQILPGIQELVDDNLTIMIFGEPECLDMLNVNLRELIDFTIEDAKTFTNIVKKTLNQTYNDVITQNTWHTLGMLDGFKQNFIPLMIGYLNQNQEDEGIIKSLLKKYNTKNLNISLENIQLKETMCFHLNMIAGLYDVTDSNKHIILLASCQKKKTMDYYISTGPEFRINRQKTRKYFDYMFYDVNQFGDRRGFKMDHELVRDIINEQIFYIRDMLMDVYNQLMDKILHPEKMEKALAIQHMHATQIDNSPLPLVYLGDETEAKFINPDGSIKEQEWIKFVWTFSYDDFSAILCRKDGNQDLRDIADDYFMDVVCSKYTIA